MSVSEIGAPAKQKLEDKTTKIAKHVTNVSRATLKAIKRKKIFVFFSSPF